MGNLKPRTTTNNDYDRNDYNYQPHSLDRRYFSNNKLDYNINSKNVFSLTYNYDSYFSAPDGLNSVVPIYDGTGTVLGSTVNAGQRSVRFVGIIALRSAIRPSITNEFHGGLDGGTVLFRDTINDGLFSTWRGYNPSFAGGYVAGVTSVSTPQRRNSPTKSFTDNVSWVKGAHQLSFGGNFEQVNLFQSTPGSVNSIIPGITFGVSSLDPAFNGATDLFNTTNFPGISSTDRTNATKPLRAADGSYFFDYPRRESGRGRQICFHSRRWIGTAFATTGCLRRTPGASPGSDTDAGTSLREAIPFRESEQNLFGGGYAGLYGVSGVGNLFKPGATGGSSPTYTQIGGSAGYAIPGRPCPPSAWPGRFRRGRVC